MGIIPPFRRTAVQALALLKQEGVEVGREVLSVVVEAVVGTLKVERKNGVGGDLPAATSAAQAGATAK